MRTCGISTGPDIDVGGVFKYHTGGGIARDWDPWAG